MTAATADAWVHWSDSCPPASKDGKEPIRALRKSCMVPTMPGSSRRTPDPRGELYFCGPIPSLDFARLQMAIWFNVSTSAYWRRPPLGIVRVERRLAEELRQKLWPEHLRFCVWDRDVCTFVAWEGRFPDAAVGPLESEGQFEPLGSTRPAGRLEALRSIGRGIAGLLPTRVKPLLERTGQNLETALTAIRVRLRKAVARGRLGAAPNSSFNGSRSRSIERGDVLITVGLDWETGFPPVLAELKSRIGFNVIGFCHDLIPIKYPQYTPIGVSEGFTDYLRQIASYCEAIACVSESTQADLREALSTLGLPCPRLIRVRLGTDIPGGWAQPSEAVSAVAAQPFILYVSTIERRKNHQVLYQAMHRMAERHDRSRIPRLVFVGSLGWGVSDTLEEITLDPLTQGLIVVLHHVSDSELRLLYRQALFCVFPSLYEGWGIPIAEALSFGKPMICSDRGSIPEVGQDLVDYVDPWDVPGWVRAIEGLWLDETLRAKRAARIRDEYKAASWTETALPIADLALALESNTRDRRDATASTDD